MRLYSQPRVAPEKADILTALAGDQSSGQLLQEVVMSHPLMQSLGFKPRRGQVKTCLVCGTAFYVKPSHAAFTFTCSCRCSALRQRRRVPLTCEWCAKTFERPRSCEKWAKIRQRRHVYCSRDCKDAATRGEGVPVGGVTALYHHEYRAWHAMLQRCNNPGDARYVNYGGRGIGVCSRWMLFASFYADMGPRPSPKHSLDRIDNEGDYQPENCRWALPRQQCRNTRRNRWITWRGQTRCMSEWCEALDISLHTLLSRLDAKWSLDDAFTRPVASGYPRLKRCSM